MSIAEQIVASLASGQRLPPQIRRSVRVYGAIIDGAPRKIVRCGGTTEKGCGVELVLAARTLREMRVQGREPLCGYCRKPTHVRVTQAHRNYWLSRFSLDELIQLAEDAWGPREYWPRVRPPVV